MSLKFLGEVEVEGYPFKMSPSFAGIIAIEEKAGKGVPEIIQGFNQGKVSYRDIIAIAWGLSFVDGEEKHSFQDVGEHVIRVGIAKFAEPFAECLATSITGESPAESKKNIEGLGQEP